MLLLSKFIFFLIFASFSVADKEKLQFKDYPTVVLKKDCRKCPPNPISNKTPNKISLGLHIIVTDDCSHCYGTTTKRPQFGDSNHKPQSSDQFWPPQFGDPNQQPPPIDSFWPPQFGDPNQKPQPSDQFWPPQSEYPNLKPPPSNPIWQPQPGGPLWYQYNATHWAPLPDLFPNTESPFPNPEDGVFGSTTNHDYPHQQTTDFPHYGLQNRTSQRPTTIPHPNFPIQYPTLIPYPLPDYDFGNKYVPPLYPGPYPTTVFPYPFPNYPGNNMYPNQRPSTVTPNPSPTKETTEQNMVTTVTPKPGPTINGTENPTTVATTKRPRPPRFVPWTTKIEQSFSTYIVSIELFSTGTKNFIFNHTCVGVIISEKFVVTTANCVTKVYKECGYRIRAGSIMLGGSWGQISNVVEKFIHPNHTKNLNDIALLRLETKLEFNERVNILELPKNYTQPNGKGEIHEWPAVEIDLLDLQRSAELSIVPVNTCSRMLLKYQPSFDINTFSNEGNFCTESASDSLKYATSSRGSPWVQNGKLVGIMSEWEDFSCNCINAPRIYTNVANYISFIEKHITRSYD